jgi:hypothetical protein
MHWLTRQKAQESYSDSALVPQVISLSADVPELLADIPVAPDYIGTDQGPPLPINRWYGCIDERLIIVDSQVNPHFGHSSVLIHTAFVGEPSGIGDWKILPSLRSLPKAIHVSRPLFIESRARHPPRVVYRPSPQGWKSVLYKAASQADAEQLMSFLTLDAWNQSCFIGNPEPAGNWVAFQGEERISGSGSELNAALQIACKWSLRYPGVKVSVRDTSGVNGDVFKVFQGHVLEGGNGLKGA